EVAKVTPILEENLKALGIDIAEGLEQGVNEGVKEKEYRNIFQRIIDWCKGIFKQHSPSRVFIEIGKNVSLGLYQGVSSDINDKERSWKDIWTSLWQGARTTSDTELSATNRTVENKLSDIVRSINFSDIGSTWRKLWEPFGDTVDKELAWANKQLGWSISDLVHKLKWNDISSAWRNIWNNLSTPKIKLPHFSITGSFSLSPLKVPKVSVKWYDKGGIFYGPQIIGVGEKRPEFVGALDDLREIVRDEIKNANAGGGGATNDSPIEITLQIGETELGRVVIDSINKLQKQEGRILLEL
ncbi:MAG: hypothetical protein WBJ89_00150, partial [Caldicoprobacterales bacterium]